MWDAIEKKIKTRLRLEGRVEKNEDKKNKEDMGRWVIVEEEYGVQESSDIEEVRSEEIPDSFAAPDQEALDISTNSGQSILEVERRDLDCQAVKKGQELEFKDPLNGQIFVSKVILRVGKVTGASRNWLNMQIMSRGEKVSFDMKKYKI